MAITASYWKAWQMLLIMTAYNPEEFGTAGWKSYPTLRALMEMCITNQFVFPPPTAGPDQVWFSIRGKFRGRLHWFFSINNQTQLTCLIL